MQQVFQLIRYVLNEEPYTLGIYSTFEKAEAAKESYEKTYPENCFDSYLEVKPHDIDFSFWEP